MHIKILIISFLLLMAGPRVLFAQVQLEGEWKLDKVKVRLVSEQGNNLLEEKILDSLPHQVTMVGEAITFRGQHYMMQGVQGLEQGAYLLLSDGSLAFRNFTSTAILAGGQQIQQPDIFCKVSTPNVDSMVIALPAVFYKDHTRNLIVKEFFICQYNRKK